MHILRGKMVTWDCTPIKLLQYESREEAGGGLENPETVSLMGSQNSVIIIDIRTLGAPNAGYQSSANYK